jgi:hypothetical protein
MRIKSAAIIVVAVGIVAAVALVAWQIKGRVMGSAVGLSGSNSNIQVAAKIPVQSADHGRRTNPVIDNQKNAKSSASAARSVHVPQKMDQVSGKTSFQWNGPALSPQVELAVGIRKSKSQEDRWGAIHGLGKSLSQDEINAVGSPDEDIRGQKNDILSALIDQEPQPARLQDELLSMFRDKTHEEWWRNFCVQHFELLYRKKWPNSSTGGGDEERRAMKDAYSEAVRAVGNSIAGTALLGLARLSEDYPEFEKSSIMRDAVSIAANQGADQRSRIAALQVAGRLGCVDILPVARSVVTSGAGVSFRMAAIATLGEVGKSEDKDVLRQIMTGSDPYLQKAATKALNCIELRVAGVNSNADGR